MRYSRDKLATVQLSKIRMREEMRAKLAAEAKARGMTLNRVIVERLDRSFVGDPLIQALYAFCEAVLATRHGLDK